MIKIEKALM